LSRDKNVILFIFFASVALAALTITSHYTAFSTIGGGQLFGFEPGQDGQYKVDQILIIPNLEYNEFAPDFKSGLGLGFNGTFPFFKN
jgi:hypothetical protein